MLRPAILALVLALPLSVAGTGAPRADRRVGPEAKKPLDETTLLVAHGDAAVPLVITRPGRYRLGGDLEGRGIEITASDVTLDLGGHALRPGGASGDAISVAPGCSGVAVRNGVIAGWTGWGVSAARARNGSFERLTLRGNVAGGLDLGSGALVRRCNAEGNGVGLRASGVDAWIAGNDLRGNALGLEVVGTDNVLASNLAETSRIGGGNTVAAGR